MLTVPSIKLVRGILLCFPHVLSVLLWGVIHRRQGRIGVFLKRRLLLQTILFPVPTSVLQSIHFNLTQSYETAGVPQGA